MKNIKSILMVSLFLASNTAYSCDVTISPKSQFNNISDGVALQDKWDTICLTSGTYYETRTIALKQGQTLKGLNSDRLKTKVRSSADTVITLKEDSIVYNFNIIGDSSDTPDIGVEAREDDRARIWDLNIEYVTDAIHVFKSDDVKIWGNWTENNGKNNSKPDPNIFAWRSHDLEILYGIYIGAANGTVGGDGEIAIWESDNTWIEGVQVVDSGASSIYFIDCDDCTVKNSTLDGGDGWGLDIMDGSSNFTAIGNTVKNHLNGGSVFDETDNGTGTYTNNSFTNNNTSGSRTCQGINVIGNTSNVTLSGNSANPAPIVCSY